MIYTQRIAPFPGTVSNDKTTSLRLPDGAIIQFGQGTVNTITLSPNGYYIVLGDATGLWWYEAETLSLIALWETDCKSASVVTFSPSGEWIATGHEDGSVKVWDVQQGICFTQTKRQIYPNSKAVYEIVFSPDCEYIAASGREDYVVDVWNPENGKHLAQFGDPEIRYRHCTLRRPVAFSKDKHLIAFATPPDDVVRSDNEHFIEFERDTIAVWDVSRKECITQLKNYYYYLHDLVFSPCGCFLISISDENNPTLTIWDTANWKVQKEIQYSSDYLLIPKYLKEEAIRIATVSDTTVTFWDAELDEQLAAYPPLPSNWSNLDFNGTQFAFSTPNELKVWNIGDSHPRLLQHCRYGPPNSFVFSGDGKTLAAEHRHDGILFWDVVTHRKKPIVFKPPGNYHRLYTSHSGHLYTTSVKGTTVHLWEVEKESHIVQLELKEIPWHDAVSFSHETQLLTFGDSENNIHIWNVDSEQIVHRFTGHKTPVVSASFSPNGKYLASEGMVGPDFRLWDLERGKEISSSQSSKIMCFAFSPNSNLVAGDTEEEILIVDIEQANIQTTIPKRKGHWYQAFTFSPCGRYLAIGGISYINLWSVETGENIANIGERSIGGLVLAFAPDGETLASVGSNGIINLWDVKCFIDL